MSIEEKDYTLEEAKKTVTRSQPFVDELFTYMAVTGSALTEGERRLSADVEGRLQELFSGKRETDKLRRERVAKVMAAMNHLKADMRLFVALNAPEMMHAISESVTMPKEVGERLLALIHQVARDEEETVAVYKGLETPKEGGLYQLDDQIRDLYGKLESMVVLSLPSTQESEELRKIALTLSEKAGKEEEKEKQRTWPSISRHAAAFVVIVVGILATYFSGMLELPHKVALSYAIPFVGLLAIIGMWAMLRQPSKGAGAFLDSYTQFNDVMKSEVIGTLRKGADRKAAEKARVTGTFKEEEGKLMAKEKIESKKLFREAERLKRERQRETTAFLREAERLRTSLERALKY